MARKLIITFLCCGCALAQTMPAGSGSRLTTAQRTEMYAMVADVNIPSLAWRMAVMQRMITEANFFVSRLHLPSQPPIQLSDVVYAYIPPPWFCLIERPDGFPASTFGTNIYDAHIAREARLRALEFGPKGYIETTNFQFGFYNGTLSHVMRLRAHQVERYANNLDELVGKPSLINNDGAYQLATQWLAAVDVNMVALNKLKWSVHQLRYLPHHATSSVLLPIYYVDFGNKHYPAIGNIHAFDVPLVSVEVLGTTKELQDLRINVNDLSVSRRPLLLITNALNIIRTPNPPIEQFKKLSGVQTNSPSP